MVWEVIKGLEALRDEPLLILLWIGGECATDNYQLNLGRSVAHAKV